MSHDSQHETRKLSEDSDRAGKKMEGIEQRLSGLKIKKEDNTKAESRGKKTQSGVVSRTWNPAHIAAVCQRRPHGKISRLRHSS